MALLLIVAACSTAPPPTPRSLGNGLVRHFAQSVPAAANEPTPLVLWTHCGLDQTLIDFAGVLWEHVDDPQAATASLPLAAPTPRQPTPVPRGTSPATPVVSTTEPVQWREPAAYSFTLESWCGERLLIGRFRVEVQNGETVGVEALEGYTGPAPVPPTAVPTLEMILNLAADARREGASQVGVTLDPTDGHPIFVNIDWRADAIDDEECYMVSDYLPASIVP